jgi:hypothetical protein
VLAPFVAALALLSAPPATPVICTPGLPLGGEYTGQAILLSPVACMAARLVAASPRGRARLVAVNHLYPDAYLATVGIGLLIVLHESEHATGVYDETTTECRAFVLLPQFLRRYLTVGQERRAYAHAAAYDGSMGAAYHARPCGGADGRSQVSEARGSDPERGVTDGGAGAVP